MILVTLGTQKQQFKRLLDYIEESNIDDEIIVQAGYTKYKSNKMKVFDFISYKEMNKYLEKCDLVITHGGTGSILTPLKMGKKVIACARKKEYHEHFDDHQMELVSLFDENGYIKRIDSKDELQSTINNIDKFRPKKYVSNTDNFIGKLVKMINN